MDYHRGESEGEFLKGQCRFPSSLHSSLSISHIKLFFVFGNSFPFLLPVGIRLRVSFAGIVHLAFGVALLFARFLVDRLLLLWRLASLQSLHLAG